MLDSILGAWGVLGSVLWGERLALYFVEKCSLSLYLPSIARQNRGVSPTIFAPYMPPTGAGKAGLALPSLDGQLSTGRTLTLSQ
jgi:hypothetical protein